MDITHKPSPVMRTIAVVIAIAAVVSAVYFGWRYVHNADMNPLSQDAVITANVVNVAFALPGRIVKVGVEENGYVEKGQVLAELDPLPFRLVVEQTAADLKIAEAALADSERTVSAERSNAVIAQEQVKRAEVNLQLATHTLERLQALRPKGYVSAQQVDDAATLKHDAEVSLRQARHQLEAANALVSNAAAATALVEARKAALAIAERALADAVIRAPFSGRVAGTVPTVGAYAITGQSLFSLIDTGAWYASANFVETRIPSISVGDCASVYVLADPATPVRGVVESIGWGVASEDVINLPRIMPLVPKNLDWVRVAQRFPVRIRLLDPPENLMRAGASITVTVHHGTRC
ncbi:multidrug transporter subunit MdtN [Pseudochelatococcus contaminans]|uniref:Multidrug efflux system membrane fusion protein n=1 Tax=Pseudochelatococcus contaminans TaxID=1538103 RepID=A0A7W5Z1I8_9HYPH|nr:multidrug efflux system membrane fusion protein [Pseudochelatococcus contaminans]